MEINYEVNTLRVGNKNKSINAVQENNRRLL